MADHFQASIDALKDSIEELEEQIYEKKKLVNLLATHAGIPVVYPEIDLGTGASTGGMTIRKAEFFNKPLTSAIKAYLSRRKDKPATAEDIYAALLAGGYDQFASKKEDAINGLRISMGKNAAVFARIPDGDNFLYGLNEWYGITKRAKTGAGGKEEEVETQDLTGIGRVLEGLQGSDPNGGAPS